MNATHRSPADTALADHVRHRLDAAVPPVPGARGPDAAAARGRARRRNRRAVLASVAAIAVVVAATQTVPDDPARTELATASGQVHVDPSLQLDWTVTDDGLSMVTGHSAGDALYALSTAPRTRPQDHPDGDVPRAMYRLGEDGRWAPIPLEGDDPALSQVTQRGDVLYALSTGAIAGADGAPLGSVSSDGGQSWSSMPLQVAAPPSPDVAWTVSYTLDLAATAEHTVALVGARIGIPVRDLFPELQHDDPERSDEAALSTLVDGRGVHLVEAEEDGSAGPVVRTVPWSDLGVTGPDDIAPQRWAYVADGDTWTEVRPPVTATSPEGGSTELAAVGDRFLLTHAEWHRDGTATTTALRSTDGRTWAPIPVPGAGQLLAVADAMVHVGLTPGPDGTPREAQLQVSRDGGTTWGPLDLGAIDPSLADLEQPYAHAAAGPLGIAVVVGDAEGPATTLLYSPDASAWTVADLAEVAPHGTWFGEVLVGADRLVVLGHTLEGEPGSPTRSATLTAVPRRT